MTNKVKEKEKKKKRLSIYLNSKGRHEVRDAEFLIIQSIKESLMWAQGKGKIKVGVAT